MNINHQFVSAFLGSLVADNMTLDEAFTALRSDTKNFNLNPATSAAIASGIRQHFWDTGKLTERRTP